MLRLPDQKRSHSYGYAPDFITKFNPLLVVKDTAGQERFHDLGTTFYRGSDGEVLIATMVLGSSRLNRFSGFLLVFDVSNKSTFESLPQHRALCHDLCPSAYYVVIGNKIDAEQRTVSKEEAEAWSASIGAPYFETSARNSNGVVEAFNGLVKGIISSSIPLPSVLFITTALPRRIIGGFPL